MAQKRSSDSERTKSNATPVNGSARPLTLGKEKDYVYDDELRRLQIELVKLQGWIRHKELKLVAIRGTRRSRERRRDQEDHRQFESARLSRSRPGHSHRTRKDAVVFPALCGTFAGCR